MLSEHECYKKIKSVNLAPVLAVVNQLKFVDSRGVCAWTSDPSVQAPEELLDLVRSLNLGGQYYRVFCRKLLPKQNIAPHTDDHEWMKGKNFRRFQIPLVSDPNIIMRWPEDNIEIYLEPGYLWEVNFKKLHEVINNSNDIERIHIQIDQQNATI